MKISIITLPVEKKGHQINKSFLCSQSQGILPAVGKSSIDTAAMIKKQPYNTHMVLSASLVLSQCKPCINLYTHCQLSNFKTSPEKGE
jgi:hypothetical protein